MEVLRNTRQGLWLEDSLRKRELIMKRHLRQWKGTLTLEPPWNYIHDEVEFTLDGCEDNFP